LHRKVFNTISRQAHVDGGGRWIAATDQHMTGCICVEANVSRGSVEKLRLDRGAGEVNHLVRNRRQRAGWDASQASVNLLAREFCNVEFWHKLPFKQ
jgi:hypothetical protein